MRAPASGFAREFRAQRHQPGISSRQSPSRVGPIGEANIGDFVIGKSGIDDSFPNRHGRLDPAIHEIRESPGMTFRGSPTRVDSKI